VIEGDDRASINRLANDVAEKVRAAAQ